MTSNCSEEFYSQISYDKMLGNYKNSLSAMVCGDALQINDYSKYNWTIFNPESKKARHDTVFPNEKEKVFSLGAEMVKNLWEKLVNLNLTEK